MLKKSSFLFLNTAQFFGTLNDNLFKLLLIYFLIDLEGSQIAPILLAKVGAIFILPFLLFSSASGIFADRLSKRGILIMMKAVEALIMLLIFFALIYRSSFFSFLLLFLLGMQAAIFSPAKYAILPEIVKPQELLKANGTLTSFAYLGIILGTSLASLVFDLSAKSFFLSFSVCVFIALIGFFASLKIEKTPPKGEKKFPSPLFPYEIYQTLKATLPIPHLLLAIFGSAFFLFMGSFVQLNIIPFALQSLELSEVAGGYLFLLSALGIALGSFLAGKLSKGKADLRLSRLAALALSLLFALLFLCSHSLMLTMLLLFFLGLFGGMFLIPFDTFIQLHSPESKRGRTIASATFLGFCGALLSSLFLYLISGYFHLYASVGFLIMGGFVFLFFLLLSHSLKNRD